MRGFAGAFLSISGLLYIMLMTNLMIAVTCAPVWLLLVFVDLSKSWLWVALSSILLSPALAGAYTVFKGYSLDASVTAIRTFFRAWWSTWRRLGLVGLFFLAFFLVISMDFYVLTQWGYGTFALPLTVVLLALGLITAMVSWVGLLDRPDLSRRAVLKASLYLAVRKPGWSIISLLVLAAVASIIWVQPAVGLGILIGPALYIVWGNSRRTLVTILPQNEQIIDDNAPSGPAADHPHLIYPRRKDRP